MPSTDAPTAAPTAPGRRQRLAALILTASTLVTLSVGIASAEVRRPWPQSNPEPETLAERLAPPPGFARTPAAPSTFAEFLRQLPMKPDNSPVMLFNGLRKPRQDVHVAVVDIDVEKRDLQQCADAVMRLRAEWLWSIGARDRIAFDYTGGGRVPYSRFATGAHPSTDGKTWRSGGKADGSYQGFRRYMTNVFIYAGTYSLARELKAVAGGVAPEIGDVIIKGGFPGHAVLVVDMAENKVTGEKRFLLAQSYMPAQDIHILKNPQARDGNPWYPAPISWPLVTPEWTFEKGSLERWPE